MKLEDIKESLGFGYSDDGWHDIENRELTEKEEEKLRAEITKRYETFNEAEQ